MSDIGGFDKIFWTVFVYLPGVFAFLGLLGGFAVVRERVAKAREEGRNWFQVSLLTVNVTMLALGLIVTLNTAVLDEPSGSSVFHFLPGKRETTHSCHF